VTLYPNTFPLLVEKLIQQTDVYLDINHDDKLSVVYDYISRFEKPILSFENTQSQELSKSAYAGIFSAERPEEMVAALTAYLDEKTHEN
ncbi:MAG: glycosyl hydrolase family 8, partial [Streptococcus sp.]|nr:glycosyl hydrolase family 8 [Streptococcus sp.]